MTQAGSNGVTSLHVLIHFGITKIQKTGTDDGYVFVMLNRGRQIAGCSDDDLDRLSAL
jgi:hypothetical protein